MLRWGFQQIGGAWTTVGINVAGSFLMGVLLVRFGTHVSSDHLRLLMRLFLIPGFLGGFTTFSAFSAESIELMGAQRIRDAAIYIGVSVGLSLLGVVLGMSLAREKWGG